MDDRAKASPSAAREGTPRSIIALFVVVVVGAGISEVARWLGRTNVAGPLPGRAVETLAWQEARERERVAALVNLASRRRRDGAALAMGLPAMLRCRPDAVSPGDPMSLEITGADETCLTRELGSAWHVQGWPNKSALLVSVSLDREQSMAVASRASAGLPALAGALPEPVTERDLEEALDAHRAVRVALDGIMLHAGSIDGLRAGLLAAAERRHLRARVSPVKLRVKDAYTEAALEVRLEGDTEQVLAWVNGTLDGPGCPGLFALHFTRAGPGSIAARFVVVFAVIDR